MTLYDFFLVAATLVFVTVAAVMGWGIVRRRQRQGAPANAAERESLRRELLWWALPTILMLLLFVLTIVSVTRA